MHRVVLLCLLAFSLCCVQLEAHTVELKVVVDESAMDIWKEHTGKSSDEDFKKELNSIFVAVTDLYASLERWGDIKVKFSIKDLTLNARGVVDAPYGDITSRGLDQFREWIFDRKKYEKGDWDIALVLTGNDVVGDTKSMLGYGQIGKVCTDWGVGMVEYRSETYKDAFVIAHEIGHILGANHDGFTDLGGLYCDPNEGYVMTSITPVRNIHHFNFSLCSESYFYNTRRDGLWSCLEDSDDIPLVTGKKLGEVEGGDETCRREMDDKHAVVDRSEYRYYGDNVCTYIWCTAGKDKKNYYFSPQGMPCGKNKQCIQGKCVVTANGSPDVSDECPFGDAPYIDYKGYHSCKDLPLRHCGAMKDMCCQRCSKVVGLNAADQACKKLRGNPESVMLRDKYPVYYGDAVCRQLICTDGYRRGSSEISEHKYKAPEGMACGKGNRCMNGKCLPSRTNPPTVESVCPFGDLLMKGWSCRDRLQGSPSNCRSTIYRNRCCSFCLNL